MKLFDRLFQRKSSSNDLPDILGRILSGGASSKSGVLVNKETAMRVSAVFACLKVISEGVAQVPFKVMRKSKSAVSMHPERHDATDHALYDLLHRSPNGWNTSFELREIIVLHAGLTGNAYVFKNQVNVGLRGPVISELIVLDPSRVAVKQRDNWEVEYEVRGKNGEVRVFPAETIWHIRGPSWNGVVGMDVLDMAREAIGLSIASEDSQSRLNRNGMRPSGVYSVDGTLSPDQYKQLKKWLESENAGVDNAGSIMLLDRAAKFQSIAMTGVDAQHLETRRLQIEEVCRYFRVMPIMIGYSDKTATYASAEQMFLAHVVHCLMPWYERIQQSADVNLLTKQERADGYYIKLMESGLLRGAMKDTAEYLYRLTTSGIMERNEARAKLDLNPIEGLDLPLTPVNMTTATDGADSPE